MPANDGLRLDDHERSFPTIPSPAQESPEGAIEVGQRRPPVRSGQEDRELLAQSQVLEGQLAPGSESGYGGSEEHSKKAKHGGREYSALGAKRLQVLGG